MMDTFQDETGPVMVKKTTSYRRRNIVVASGFLLFVAAIALSVGVVTATKSGNSNAASSAGDAISSGDEIPYEEGQMLLSKPGTFQLPSEPTQKKKKAPTKRFSSTRSFISQVCSVTGDKKACEDICTDAPDCCNFHNGQDVSCLEEEIEGCVTHAACHVLAQEEGDVPAAPVDLADWCDDSSPGYNPTACQQACEPVACCYDGQTQSCLRDQFMMCLDYAPCQNLRPNAALKVAPPDLDETCNPFMGNREDCEETCELNAGCCWDDNLLGNCLPNNVVSCLTYAPCATLLLDNANGVVESPPENLDQVCSLQNLLIGDSQPCEDACEPASCCAATDMADNCFLSDPLACIEYDSCGLLWLLQRGDDLPKPPANLGQTCSLAAVMSDPEPCQEACEVASCCADRDFEDNCLVRGNVLRCREYAPCVLLALTGNGGGDDEEGGGGGGEEEEDGGDVGEIIAEQSLEDPPENLGDVCNFKNTRNPRSESRQACRDLCETASCCAARGEENCSVQNMGTCLSWISGGCFWVGF